MGLGASNKGAVTVRLCGSERKDKGEGNVANGMRWVEDKGVMEVGVGGGGERRRNTEEGTRFITHRDELIPLLRTPSTAYGVNSDQIHLSTVDGRISYAVKRKYLTDCLKYYI